MDFKVQKSVVKIVPDVYYKIIKRPLTGIRFIQRDLLKKVESFGLCGQWPQFLLESTRIVEQQLNNNFSCCPYGVSVLNGEMSAKRELAVNGVYGPFREHRRRKCQYLYLLLRSFLFSVRLDIVFLKYWRNFTRFWQNAHVAITVFFRFIENCSTVRQTSSLATHDF